MGVSFLVDKLSPVYHNVYSLYHNMKRKPYSGTQAVLRALALLKTFTQERPELALGELAAAVGLNKTTAYRLLTAFESEGMIARTPDSRGYRLGPEMLALGSRALSASSLRLASRPELLALASATQETATTEILVGTEVLILDETMGSHVVGSMPSLATRWPAYATSTGKVLLAHLTQQEREELLPQKLRALTPKTITSRDRLERELARVRERGYSVAAEELELGFVAVGAPIHSAAGVVVAAVSVGGPKSRLSLARVTTIAQHVSEAAQRISQRLGFSQRSDEKWCGLDRRSHRNEQE